MIKNHMNDIDRYRAVYALNFVDKGVDEDKNYVSHVKKVPMLILNNGLLPTLVFMYQKGEKTDKTYKTILKQLENWCSKVEDMIGVKNKIFSPKSRGKVFLNIAKLPQPEYRYWTKEILSLLVWMKRFAEGKEIEIMSKERDSNV